MRSNGILVREVSHKRISTSWDRGELIHSVPVAMADESHLLLDAGLHTPMDTFQWRLLASGTIGAFKKVAVQAREVARLK
jgi:hypothetical protein